MFAARGILARYLCGLLLAFQLPAAARTSGKDVPPAPNADAPRFERDVRPILEARCFRCHGGQRKKADLDLTSLKGLLKGSESGPVVVPGKADKSLLYEMVHSGKMPPQKKARLSADELATIRRWLDAGMPTTASSAQEEITQQQIVPLMLRHCTVCHGGRQRLADLDLRTRAGMHKGGKSGPVLVPGNPEASLLLKVAVPGDKHPLQKLLDACVRPMTAEDIARLRTWIAHGAPEVPWQADVATTQLDPLVSDQDRQFWAFRPPVAAAPPAVHEAGRVRNPVDAFILKKLEEKRLTLASEADRLTLLRRASFDLLGLPPSPEETQAFLADTAPEAYERLIDRLLASPRYGERWGRYWLDCAGYADSDGKRNNDPIRPFAYRYRDYVIRSFNADKPYDRFLLEQIAGDELVDYEHGPLTPAIYENLVATGFLNQVPDGTGANVVNLVPVRLDVIADQMEVFGATVLGLTLKCARCHSHKLDPIPQRDYYRLLAVFRGALDEYDWLHPGARNRLLMTSSTYRQKSQTPGDDRLDADNRLLSRMPLKRMEAEVLYDTLLQVAGRLNDRPFGPPDPVETRDDGLVTPVGTAAGWRRAVYVLQQRKAMPTVLESFDLPQMNPNCVQRVDTTVPSQALYLRNNSQVYQLAGSFADRMLNEVGPEPSQQIDRVSVADWHATLLYLLGLHHDQLFFERAGFCEKLTSTFPAKVVRDILA